ncbi:MAG: acetate/propionate family kinase [Isosphaeraceae bacterium]
MSHDVLVINAGSSSIKVSLYVPGTADEPELQMAGQVEEIGTAPRAILRRANKEVLIDHRWPTGDGPRNHDQTMEYIVRVLGDFRPDWKPAGVGHRVLHGGTLYREPTIIDTIVRANLDALIPLGPLHQPANLQGIDAAMKAYPDSLQIACFDTAFHQGHPWVADTYALPRDLYEQGIRRYGFHSLSYAYIAGAMWRIAPEVAGGRMVVAHLGNGASMCAIRKGRSMDCTLGLTGLDGLAMGTRCGQIDPGVLLYLLGEKGMTVAELSDLLYKKSGLLGLSGLGSDMRDLLASNSFAARQAVDYFIYRATCSAGSLVAALGGLDGIVFTAGIGENSAEIRARICRGLSWMGLVLDEAANDAGGPCISKSWSAVSAWVVPTNEERMIAISVAELLRATLSDPDRKE